MHMAVFAGVPSMRTIATAAIRSVSLSSVVSKHLLYCFGDVPALQQSVEVGFASLPNVRNGGTRELYPTQDRAVVGTLRKNSFFGVFDGHGTLGDKIADLLQKELVRRVLLSKEPGRSLEKSFADMQEMFNNLPDAKKAGAAAVVALLEDKKLTLAHVGDSRAIVVRHGNVIHATVDHKPADLREKERIEKQGGYVANGRAVDPVHQVSYGLARSMGDVDAQKYALTAHPDIAESFVLQKNDVFILATDGVWDVFSNEEVANFIEADTTAQEIAQSVVDEARARKSMDDITALVVRIQ